MPWPNPFKGVERPREVWAWGMFDLANQSFTLLINTLLFATFFKVVVLADHPRGDFIWSMFGSISMLIVVLLSPVLGAFADQHSCKKQALMITGVACAGLTCVLALLPAGNPAQSLLLPIAIAAAVYVPANIAFNLGENLVASFLPEIARRDNMGRVSAIGWTMGYLGALLVLGFVAVLIPVLGIQSVEDWRPLIFFAGLWFALNMIPTAVFLKERGRGEMATMSIAGTAHASGTKQAMKQSLVRLLQAMKDLVRFKDLLILLAGFLIYAMGVQTIIFFAGVIARDDFQFEEAELVGFAGLLALVAGIAAATTGIFQDKLGHKATILSFLGVWIITALGMALIVHLQASGNAPKWTVWILGCGIGFGLGGIGTATRALVGVFTPRSRTAEFFALWGVTYRLAAVIGLPIFGAVRAWIGSVASNFVLAGFFIIGGLILTAASVHRGQVAADEEDERNGKQSAD